MNVKDIVEKCCFTLIHGADLEREIEGVYAGDLLSWVMGHGEYG